MTPVWLQVEDAECVEIMTKILNETFDVLELDPFYAALVPMHRKGFIDNVIFAGKGSVASYAAHFPSSHQHYKAKQLVDTRALNGFIMRKARELNTPAPINECAPRCVLCEHAVCFDVCCAVERRQPGRRSMLWPCECKARESGFRLCVYRGTIGLSSVPPMPCCVRHAGRSNSSLFAFVAGICAACCACCDHTASLACRYITRQVIAISNATAVSGIPREEWDVRVKLSAAKRLVEHMGLGTSVWGHASARMPDTPDRMLLAAFGESFGEATASTLRLTPTHPDELGKEGRDTTNVTAVVLHGAVYSQRPDAGCVLHTHSPHCTALAASNLEFDAEIIQVRHTGNPPFHRLPRVSYVWSARGFRGAVAGQYAIACA